MCVGVGVCWCVCVCVRACVRVRCVHPVLPFLYCLFIKILTNIMREKKHLPVFYSSGYRYTTLKWIKCYAALVIPLNYLYCAGWRWLNFKQTNKPALFVGLAGFNEHWSLVIIAFYTFIPNLPATLITLACKQTNKQKYYTFIPFLPQMLITSLTDTWTHTQTLWFQEDWFMPSAKNYLKNSPWI